MSECSFFKTRTTSTKVRRRLNKLLQKLPYELYEYNPTGIKLIRNEITETKSQSTTNETTRFLYLIKPIPVNKESKENAIASKTAINTRSPIPNPKLNINPSQLKDTKKEKIPIIHVINDIHPITVKIVLRYGCNLLLISFTKWALRISFINLRLSNFATYHFFISFSIL